MASEEEGRVILIDKPLGWTSFDAVKKVRHLMKVKKIGHAGTLDPLATGLLILCTGKMTKQIEHFQSMEKEYTGKMILGQTTPSHDRETEATAAVDLSGISAETIYSTTEQFKGVINQVPPLHSAIKVGGQRAYTLARSGKAIELKAREVTIYHFEITAIQFPEIAFSVTCSKGTYIRSLARDFGEALGVGAYLSELCRIRIGHFSLDQALPMEQIAT